jgi:prostaglandin-endoperoxide synthase 2
MLLYINKMTSSFDAVLLDSKLGQNSKEYTYVQNNFQRLWARFKFNLIFGSKIFDSRLNRSITNKLCSHGTFRPDRLSCKSDYTSYSSLTDMSYYSRHLEPASQEFMDSLPDIDTVVTLFQRPKNADGAEVQTLCTRSTLLFPTFAQHLIDSFIVTSYDPKIGFDWRKTKSPHDICLLPLYGGTEEQTTQLRLGSNEVGQKGRMKSQILNGEEWPPFLYDSQGMRKEEFDKLPLPLFIDHTLNGLPDVNERKSKIFAYGGARANITPNVSAWNALLLREHNRIAGEIEKSEPSWDDNRVFETARNVLLVIYLKLIVEEYIHHISKYGAGVFKVKPGKWMWNASW